jgi:PAS domain S-box-containing protein
MNKEKLKILIVEDSEDDLALLLRELNKGNYDIEYELTEDAKSFKSELSKKWDIIISDYSLPNFNGFEALKICNKKEIDIPFIIVSGTIGEDIAVDMMKAGCKDYIMKKNLKRLLPAVEREIEDAKIRSEKKQAEKELLKSEEKYRVLIENMGEGIAITDEEEKFVFANPAAEKIFGIGQEELKGEFLKTFIGGGEFENVKNRTKENRQRKSEVFEEEITLKDRSKKVLFIHVTPWFDNNNFKGTFVIFTDITERKWAEDNLRKSEEHYRTLLTAIPDLMFRLDEDGRFIDYHADDSSILFSTPEKFLGKHFKDILPPDISKKYETTINEAKKTGEIGKFEYELVLPNNDKRFYEARVTFYRDESVAIIRDVTDQKNAEKALIESEEKYRTIFENVQDVFYQADNNGILIEISPSVEKYAGYKRKELIGKSAVIFYHDTIERELFLKEIREKGRVTDYELKLVAKNGITLFTSVSAHLRFDANNNPIGIEGVLRDISERKKSEEALKESEERYRILIETMHDGVMQVDNNDIIQFVNNSMCEMLGYTYHELIGKIGIETIICNEDREIVREKNRMRMTGVSDKYEVRGVKKSGELIWLSISGTPMGDEKGNVIGSVGFLTDITERKHAEEEVIKISQAIKQSPVTIVITDVKGNIEYVNPKFIETTGYRPEEVIGRNPRILKSGEKLSEEYKILWDTISSGKDWTGEFHNKKKNGELYWENASISPVRNSEGKITHFLAVKEDVTEKKQKEIELVNAKEKAEESERLKSSFLANMSHELRTPMVGILGFAELMSDIAENPELKDFAENITKSGKRLLETLNLILDLSRIEAGRMEIKKSEVDIVQLSEEVFKNYVPEAEKKNLKIKFSFSEKRIICKVDERMLWESINNLINNAIKYTKTGEVKIDVNSNNNKAFIKVKDTGIGIPKNSLDTIFEEFRQVSEGYSRGFEGTGLGLTITKNFIVKNGGKISVESEIGIGSVFTIELPILKTISLAPETINKDIEIIEENFIPEKRDVHLLCVDDDSFTREYLEYILKNVYNISFAENGFAAIEMVKSKKFSLILMDINLGKGMDGIETTRKIRMLPGYENVPVIAMTAFAMKGDREEFLNGGMKDYISKPFKSNELIKMIEKVISVSNPQ